MAAKIKKGDNVIVLTGKDKGKQGEVLSVKVADAKGAAGLQDLALNSAVLVQLFYGEYPGGGEVASSGTQEAGLQHEPVE